MSFKEELQRHRDRERQQREDSRQEQASREMVHEQRIAIERTWSLRILDAVVVPLLTQFAEAYRQDDSVRKFCAADDPPDVHRCSVEWTDAAHGRFRVSFRIEYQALRFEVRHARSPHKGDSAAICENWFDCDEQSEGTISDWVRLQLMNAASKIDEQSGG